MIIVRKPFCDIHHGVVNEGSSDAFARSAAVNHCGHALINPHALYLVRVAIWTNLVVVIDLMDETQHGPIIFCVLQISIGIISILLVSQSVALFSIVGVIRT